MNLTPSIEQCLGFFTYFLQDFLLKCFVREKSKAAQRWVQGGYTPHEVGWSANTAPCSSARMSCMSCLSFGHSCRPRLISSRSFGHWSHLMAISYTRRHVGYHLTLKPDSERLGDAPLEEGRCISLERELPCDR